MKRGVMQDTGISVIQLRHVEHVGDSEGVDGRIIDWSHRWRVRGHHRRIKDRHTGEERLVWVKGHLKGPEGKPIRETDKIYSLTR